MLANILSLRKGRKDLKYNNDGSILLGLVILVAKNLQIVSKIVAKKVSK